MGDDTYLSPKEVATLLRLSETTILKMIRIRNLPAMKIGHSWRISRTKLLKWLEAQAA